MTDADPSRAHFADPWFWVCLEAALSCEFFDNWCRLYGHRPSRNHLEAMVDKATGYGDEVAEAFCAHVKDLIYDRIPHPLQQVTP